MELFIRALATVAAATKPQVNRFQPHSVGLQQWQNILHYIVCYFAAATAAQNGVGIQLIMTPLPQPHRGNGPLVKRKIIVSNDKSQLAQFLRSLHS